MLGYGLVMGAGLQLVKGVGHWARSAVRKIDILAENGIFLQKLREKKNRQPGPNSA